MVPVNTVFPPTFKAPAIPTPPATVKAPVEVELEAVVELIEVAPVTANVPPRVVAPDPTVNVFDPLTEVFPFNVVVPPIVVLPVTPKVPPTVVFP